jgi:DNA-directed RNA polymerase II subunit RPB1
MMAHRVRLMPGHTFRLSLPVAAPYNADFDGDEMNLHVPQSKTASAECATLMAVAQNTLGAQSNRPVMGIVQDSLLGLYLMTQTGVFLDHAHACRMIGHIRHAPRRLPPPAVRIYDSAGTKRVLWTGRQIFSLILPHGLYVENDAMLDDVDPTSPDAWVDPPVTVLNGELVLGVLRKAHVGTGAGGIVDTICRDMDGVACMRFMGDAQRITHEFLLQRGHHVGIHDVMLSPEGHTRVTERLEKATTLCEEIQREIVHGTPDERTQGEAAIMRLLSKTLLQTGGIVNEHMDITNSIRRMVTAGSKGSFINLSQICAALGQQSLEGGRIVAEKGMRTLPFFAHNDLSLASRGMVQNSFSLGLSPPELFFHAIGGREGLVDTAVKTSQSGYISRRMNKSMEDNVVRPGGIICTSMDDIIAPMWGSDGFHPARIERVKLMELKEPETSIRARMSPGEADMVLRAVAEIRLCKLHPLTGDGDSRVLLPYNTGRVRRSMHRAYTATDGCDDDDVEQIMQRVFKVVHTTPLVVVASLIGLINSHTLRTVPRTVVDSLLTALEHRIEYARTTACESVGCLAAQSISERGTQLTLNTFHSAGVSAKNVTLGIPRFKEILDASKSPKTPCTTFRFVAPFNTSATFAEYMADTLPLTRLSDIVKSCNILHDPDPTTTVVKDDEWIVQTDNMLGFTVPEHSSSMVVRIVLLQEVMRSRHLTPTIVRRVLSERLAGRALVSGSESNCNEWVVRIRLHNVKEMIAHGNLGREHEAILCHRTLNVLLDTMVISGHPKITGANASEDTNHAGLHVVHAYGNVLLHASASDVIDWERSTSNDMWEVYHNLGIEAAAHVIFEQMKSVVAFDGTYVDDRHILLIVDNICRGGSIMPLNRHGINKSENTSPLMRCSFEETMDVLCEAAAFAQSENARGVSTSIMTGQLASMGTGGCEVLFPQENHVSTIRSIQSSGRVMRSSCRSYTNRLDEETLEYVTNQTRPIGMRPLSPPTIDEHGTRKRARFRIVSPTR